LSYEIHTGPIQVGAPGSLGMSGGWTFEHRMRWKPGKAYRWVVSVWCPPTTIQPHAWAQMARPSIKIILCTEQQFTCTEE